MERPKEFILFVRRLRRGALLFRILWLSSIGLTGLALLLPEHRYLAIGIFPLAILFALGMEHVSKRHISAWKVSKDPNLVYWVHPTSKHESAINDSMEDCKSLTLHLRDGCQFEVDLPPSDIRTFLAWLKEENPAVRWGNYDATDSQE